MPYKSTDKTEKHKDERKRLILKTAADVFSEKGYHSTSVKDITDKAKISVGTFYLYFRNKEDLFEHLYDEVALRLNNAQEYALKKTTDNPAEKLTNVYASTIWTYLRHRALTKIMVIEAVGLNPRFEAKYADLMIKACDSMEQTLKQLKAQGIIDVLDTKASAIAHEGIFNYTIAYWLRTDHTDLKELSYPLAVFILQALKMEFDREQIKKSMNIMFEELDYLPNGFFSQCKEYYDLKAKEKKKEGDLSQVRS